MLTSAELGNDKKVNNYQKWHISYKIKRDSLHLFILSFIHLLISRYKCYVNVEINCEVTKS